jgi:hypothetical protein
MDIIIRKVGAMKVTRAMRSMIRLLFYFISSL